MDSLLILGFFALGSIYSYLLYPLILMLLPDACLSRRGAAGPMSVSVIITAYNEESQIADKIRDTLRLREIYPPLEIVVASDASSDRTDAIVAEFSEDKVRLLRSPDRNGKEFAQGLAVEQTNSEILIFTDVGTRIETGSLERLLELFGDPAVGAISSEDRIISESGKVQGEGLYVRYEMWLRRLESRKGGLVGLSGSFFAVRRAVAEDWDNDIPSDFCVAINARKLGYKSVSDSRVIGLYRDIERSRDEFSRKTRTVVRGMTALARKAEVLNPFRFGALSFQLLGHKLMRWAVPWFVMAYAAYALWLTITDVNLLVFIVPVLLLLAIALIGALSERARSNRWIGTLYYFIQSNIAIARASILFLTGYRVTSWSPSKR